MNPSLPQVTPPETPPRHEGFDSCMGKLLIACLFLGLFVGFLCFVAWLLPKGFTDGFGLGLCAALPFFFFCLLLRDPQLASFGGLATLGFGCLCGLASCSPG